MPIRSRHLLILALTVMVQGQTPAPGAGAGAAAPPKLDEIPTYKLGLEALSGSLWEVAAARFESALETPDLDVTTRRAILLRLAEARVRARQSDKALEILADPALEDDPARPFWSAQALAAAGRFRESIELLEGEALEPKAPFRTEALLTKASLERALGDTDAALATLNRLPNEQVSGLLLKAGILIELGQAKDALAVIPDPEKRKLEPAEAADARFLRASALLAADRPTEAAPIFEELAATDPEGRQPIVPYQTLTHHHAAILGLAQARMATGETAAAASGLLAFVGDKIRSNQGSPLLDRAFQLLLDCLPEAPTPNDPILTRMREWQPAPPADAPAFLHSADIAILINPADGASDAWPATTTTSATASPLAAQAMFHLALGLRREGSPESRATARRLLSRLRLEYPTHPLVGRALLVTGRWNLEDGHRAAAAAALESLAERSETVAPGLRAQALTLEAFARFKEGNFAGAANAFERASTLLAEAPQRAARLNAASSYLTAGLLPRFDELAGGVEDRELQTSLGLERGLYLASIQDPGALPVLRAFIKAHPNHPRLPEARLSAALAALDAVPPDPGYATTQLHALSTLNEEARAALPATALALAEIRLHDSKGEWEEAAARAADYLEDNPDSPKQAAIRYEQGKALFKNRDFNAALLVLKNLAKDFPDAEQTPAALLLAASAAAEGATPQSKKESLALFDRLIESKSDYADVARLEKAELLRRLADRVYLDQAIDMLAPWFDSMKDDDPLLLSVGLLLSDALYARAEGSSKLLAQTLEVCDRLIRALPENSTERYSALYKKGLTLERIEGRQDDALVAYMDVVQAAASNPRGDWKAIEDCGFSALQILEKRENWRAAKNLASRIAALGGPRSTEAAARAKDIGLVHMIWDETLPEAEDAEEDED